MKDQMLGKLGYSVLYGIFTIGYQLKNRFLTFENLLRQTISTYPFTAMLLKFNEFIANIKCGDLDQDDGSFDSEIYLRDSSLLDFSNHHEPMNPYYLQKAGRYIGVSETLVQERESRLEKSAHSISLPNQRLHINQAHLQRAWDVTQRSTASDWNEWLRRLITEMLRESSSPCLRCCWGLSQSYPNLGTCICVYLYYECVFM